MDKKQIQEERIRNFFLSAAKDLIRAEGVEVVSARNVADRAGYSYATLYNYFKDIRDLIFSCAQDFMNECREYVFQNIAEGQTCTERLASITINFTRFFIQYPGIFEMLYQHKVSSIATADSKIGNIYTFFDSLTIECWDELGHQKEEKRAHYERARKNHKLAIHGLLLLYLNRRLSVDYGEFIAEVKGINDYYLGSGD